MFKQTGVGKIYFGRSVNPISTREKDYAHLIATGTPGFSDLPTAMSYKALHGTKVAVGLQDTQGKCVQCSIPILMLLSYLKIEKRGIKYLLVFQTQSFIILKQSWYTLLFKS